MPNTGGGDTSSNANTPGQSWGSWGQMARGQNPSITPTQILKGIGSALNPHFAGLQGTPTPGVMPHGAVGDVQSAGAPPLPGNPDTAKMQLFLNNHGYKLAVDGIAGPATRAAAAAFRNRNNVPAASTPHGNTGDTAVAVPPGGRTTASAGKTGNTGSTGATAQDPLTRMLLAMGGGNVGTMLNPSQYGNAVAGAQFDPSIHDLQIQQARQPVQAQQNAHDISSWYQQALDAMKQAGTSDATQNTAEQGSLGNAVSQIVSSLGGADNQGSGLVGAAGADQVGNLAALGLIDKNYHNEMAPLMQGEAAGALTQEKNRQITNSQDIANQLASAQGQRGQAATAAQAQAIGQNNSLAQSRFANRFGIMQAIEAAQAGTATASQKAALQAAHIDHLKAQDGHLATQDAATIWKINHPNIKPGAGSWLKMTPKDKNSLYTDIKNTFGYTQQDVTNGTAGAGDIGNIRASYKNTDGSLNVPKAVHDVNQELRNRGFTSSDAGARAYRDMILKTVFNINPDYKNWASHGQF